ncbi:MAG: helix-turn-helix domain-containing protein [Thermoplasmata archaeon]|nr:helix-turn-helix domain-containing protein [Thermoplasmata archaeon]
MDSDDETKDILREILKWTKFQGMQNVKQVLENTLDTDAKKLIYHLSDGRSSPDIAAIAGVTSTTVRQYWKDWSAIGIVGLHPDYKKRFHRVFSLELVGIEIPGFEKTTKQSR